MSDPVYEIKTDTPITLEVRTGLTAPNNMSPLAWRFYNREVDFLRTGDPAILPELEGLLRDNLQNLLFLGEIGVKNDLHLEYLMRTRFTTLTEVADADLAAREKAIREWFQNLPFELPRRVLKPDTRSPLAREFHSNHVNYLKTGDEQFIDLMTQMVWHHRQEPFFLLELGAAEHLHLDDTLRARKYVPQSVATDKQLYARMERVLQWFFDQGFYFLLDEERAHLLNEKGVSQFCQPRAAVRMGREGIVFPVLDNAGEYLSPKRYADMLSSTGRSRNTVLHYGAQSGKREIAERVRQDVATYACDRYGDMLSTHNVKGYSVLAEVLERFDEAYCEQMFGEVRRHVSRDRYCEMLGNWITHNVSYLHLAARKSPSFFFRVLREVKDHASEDAYRELLGAYKKDFSLLSLILNKNDALAMDDLCRELRLALGQEAYGEMLARETNAGIYIMQDAVAHSSIGVVHKAFLEAKTYVPPERYRSMLVAVPLSGRNIFHYAMERGEIAVLDLIASEICDAFGHEVGALITSNLLRTEAFLDKKNRRLTPEQMAEGLERDGKPGLMSWCRDHTLPRWQERIRIAPPLPAPATPAVSGYVERIVPIVRTHFGEVIDRPDLGLIESPVQFELSDEWQRPEIHDSRPEFELRNSKPNYAILEERRTTGAAPSRERGPR